MVLEIFLVVFDYFSVGIFSNVSIRKSDLVEYGSAMILFRIPTSYDAVERAMANEVALNRKVDKCLGDEAA